MFGPNSLTLSVPETAKYLDTIHRNSIGLEDWMRRLDTTFETGDVNYPPYNLVKETDTRFRLELAIAGFSSDEIEVVHEPEHSRLVVKGSNKRDDVEYLHQGIASRTFNRTWTVSDSIEVKSADLNDGILKIQLENVVPVEKRPRIIEVGQEKLLDK